MNCPRVVITGMGVISSLGQGVSTLMNALLEGQSRFKKSERFSSLSFPVVAAECEDFSFEHSLHYYSTLPDTLLTAAQKAGRRAPLTIQTSLIAALEAWQQSQLSGKPVSERKLDPSRIGLVVAGHNTTQRYQHDLHMGFQQKLGYLPPSYALHFMDTDQVGTLSDVFKIHGEGFTVGGSSASGNVALIQGYRLIQQGIVDACMIVGVLADLSPLELQGFYNIGALGGKKFQNKPSKACRPFDQDHEGFIWGQASGCLILESVDKAKEAQVPLLGEIAGTSIVLDGNRLANPSADGESKAMKQVLIQARLKPSDIQYINTHGSSSPLGDTTEVKAIHTVFGETSNHVWLNSTKSITGHCLWSAGVVEAIATFLQLQKGFVHPNLNLENPIESKCRFVGQKSEQAHIQAAMSNSFGFGGINTSLILTRGGEYVSGN